MADDTRQRFLGELSERFSTRRLGGSRSLFEVAGGKAVVYVRYSRLHGGTTFFGLRSDDLRRLEGLNAFIAFLWPEQSEPVLLPVNEFSEVFQQSSPASDGQYKVQVLLREQGTELYVARAGRHNVEPFVGWRRLEESIEETAERVPALGHHQVQTLLGAIGHARGFDVWIPPYDRGRMDWSLTDTFTWRLKLPDGLTSVHPILQEIDVAWLARGGSDLLALYEVEQSTPIYSGLLRMNDIKLVAPVVDRFTIVAEEERRPLFTRQVQRPTFRASGLSEVCGFMSFPDVFHWHRRIQQPR